MLYICNSWYKSFLPNELSIWNYCEGKPNICLPMLFHPSCSSLHSLQALKVSYSTTKNLLKTSLRISKWLTTHMNNKGILSLAPFPCNRQWFSDRKVSAKITIIGLLFVCSYSVKALVVSKPITLTSDGNKTKPKMAKETAWYFSSPNFPSSLFILIFSSISFHLKL